MSLDSRTVRGAGSVAGVLLFLAVLVPGCGAEPGGGEPSGTASPSASASASPSEPTGAPTSPSAQPSPASTARPPARRGVDVSHHQGAIDWGRVRRDRIDFAYLKATEGSTFTDPQFVANARGARRAGLRVGGYHYFSLCSPGEPQAAHFSDVLASAPARTMPPAIDLELGDCEDPPPRTDLLREVRTFIEAVEQRTRQRVVVYAYPDLEARYRIAEALDRRLWVRRIGSTPPKGEWWLWQRDDHASIDGITGPADLNVLAPR
jgi:lysozyme